MKKIIWISSYLPRSCGIAYYSADYIDAIKKFAKKTNKDINIKIIAHTDALESDFPIIDLKNKNWHLKILDKVKKEKPDMVHIQHEYGLYETNGDNNQRVVELIKLIKQLGIPVVMTYHSIYKKLEPNFAKFTSNSLKELSAGIFHEDYQKEALPKNIGWTPKNLYVIPHGSTEHIDFERKKIRDVYGYSDDELIVGSAGIADERKGFRTLIHQWPKVVEKFPNALLVLEVKPHKSNETRDYINKILEEIMKSKVSKNIEFVVREYNSMQFYKRLKSFDVLVLAYKSESQSGVLAHGFAAGVPSIVTDIEGLGAEIRNSKSGIAIKNRADFYKAIIKLLASKKLRTEYSKNALKYVRNVNGWNIVAKNTFNIYDKFW